jgi:alkylation response protein AidB-like acyl-CoA dehydrogenase
VPRLMRHPMSRIVLDVVPQRIRRHPFFVTAMRSRASQRVFLRMIDRHLDPDDQRQIQRCSSMAKVTGSDVAVEVAAEALQIVGLEGALHRWELEKIFRDAKLTQIYEGTNQLNRHNLFVNLFPEERASAYR